MRQYPRANPAKWWRTRAIGGAHRSPAAMFISPLRRYASLGTLALMVGMISGGWYVTRPERVSRLSQILLGNVLNGDVVVGQGRLSLEGTLQLSGVELRKKLNGQSVRLFHADQVEMRFDWLSLLSGQLRATQLTAVRPTLYLVEDQQSGKWNFESQMAGTKTQPSSSPIVSSLPVIILREAKIQFAELNDGQYTETAATTVDGQLSPDSGDGALYRFSIQERSESSADLIAGDVNGSWAIGANSFSASASKIVLTPQLQKSLPRSVRQWWQEHELRGELNRLRIGFDAQEGLTVSVDLQDVSMKQNLGESQGFRHSLVVPIEDVSGSLDFGVGSGRLRVRGLRGKVMNLDVELAGEFRGMTADAPFEMGVRLPHARVNEYPEILSEIPAAQDLIRRLRPLGELSVELTVFRTNKGDDVDVRGMVTCHDVSARFIHFPYPLEHVRGIIRFDSDIVEFKDVWAKAGESDVLINGKVGAGPSNHFTDFDVRSDNAMLDARLAASLPSKYQKIWSQFNPEGLGKFICRVKRDREGLTEQTVEVEVYPQDVRLMYVRFPYALEHVRGKLILADEQSLIENLVGSAGGGKVTVNGEVKYPHGDLDLLTANVTVKAEKIDFDQRLLNALPEEHQAWTRMLETTGKTDIDAVVSSLPGKDLDIRGTVNVAGGSVTAVDGTWAVDHMSAQLVRNGSHMTLKNFSGTTGRDNRAQITLDGNIDEVASGYHMEMLGTLNNLTLGGNASQLLSEGLAQFWNKYRPEGVISSNFSVKLDTPATLVSGNKKSSFFDWVKDYRIEMTSQDVSVGAENWPDRLQKINGQFIVTPSRIDIERISVRADTLAITGSGSIDRDKDITDLSLRGQAAELPVKWAGMMPQGLKNTITQLNPKGSMVIDLKKIRYDAKAAQPAWEIDGMMRFVDLRTSGPVNMSAASLTLSGAGRLTDVGALDFTGGVDATHVGFANRIMNTFRGQILANGQKNSVSLQNIEGKIAGGTLQGNLLLTVSPDLKYEGQLVLSDADIASLALPESATEEERRRIGNGRVTATLAVQESFAKNGDRTGRGDMVVRDGQIYNVPLAMGLMQLATLRMPVARAFNSAQMSYYLRDQQVTFEKILLESSGINLAGMGTLNLNDHSLDLRFVTESPNEVRLPIISSVLQNARNQLLQIQVSGPVESPRIQPIPLDMVASTLQALLPKKMVNP